jgi:hypothetical protein
VTIGNVLLAIVVDNDSTPPAAPTTTSDPKFGAGAWTALATAVKIDMRFDGIDEIYHGIRAFWKVADAVNQTGGVPGTYVTAFVWELSGADMASATLVDETLQTTTGDPVTINAGSLGTVAVGELAVLGWILCSNSNPGLNGGMPGYNIGAEHAWLPLATVAPGSFTQRATNGSYDGNSGPWACTFPPLSWFGDVVGTGAAVTASVTRPRDERHGVSNGTQTWAAIGIKVPPV